MEFVRIQDSDSLIRDLSSGAVINTNTTDYQNYLAKKNSSINSSYKIDILYAKEKFKCSVGVRTRLE